jgi:hypothetical protein
MTTKRTSSITGKYGPAVTGDLSAGDFPATSLFDLP